VRPPLGGAPSPREKRVAESGTPAGEYGQAFKFPWEAGTKVTDKTVIGHVIPVVAMAVIIGGARLQQAGVLPQ